MADNDKASHRKCKEVLDKLFDPLQKKVYTPRDFHRLEADFTAFIAAYTDFEELGPAKAPALVEYLQEKLVKVYTSVVQEENVRLMKVQEEEEKEL